MKNAEILQMIPLGKNAPLFFDDSIIALALVKTADGEKQLVYIAHDRETGQPVLQEALTTHHQGI